MKVATHGSKLEKFFVMQIPNEVMALVVDDSLLTLVDCSLIIVEVPLLSIFVEHWHNETFAFIFHLVRGKLCWTMSLASFMSPLLVTSSPLH